MNSHFGMRRAVAVALLGLLVPSARPDQPAKAPQKGVTVEGITEYQLDNGLRVLLFPDNSTSKVTVNLTVFVGSRHEGYGETGMAHLLEHMLFKGTPQHPDVPKALRDHGAQFNGTTWVDRTNYFESMNAKDENLEFAIRLEADRLVNSFVKRDDLASEMTVVRNEFEAGENSPENVLSQRMMAVAYEWHNYGKSTIGNRSDIERVPIENLQAFYRKYYQPDNALLVVAGNFDEAKALGLVTKYFGGLKRPERKLDQTYTEEPAQDGERSVVLRRVGTVGVVGVVYHVPAGAHEDFAAVEVLENLLTSEPSGRLYRALVTSKKASSVHGVAYGWHDPGVVEILARVDKNESPEKARDAMLDVLEKLHTTKFTDEEVDRSKRELLKNRKLLMNDSNRIGVTLSDWAAKGDWRLFFLHRDRLGKVTPADVARVAERYLKPSNRTVGLYVPTDKAERTPIPATPVVADLVKDYKGSQTVAAGEAFDPTPENIEKRVQRPALASGLKTALLPKKSRGEAVVVQLTLRYGNEQSLKGQSAAAQLLGQMMTRGTKAHTRQQLKDELDKLEARLAPVSSNGVLRFNLECKRENLPAALKLLGEVLRQPTFPQDEFDVLKAQAVKGVEAQLTEPTALAFRSLLQKLTPYPKDDVRYVPTLPESAAQLKELTVEQVRKLYEQVGGQAGELVVVGDFDPAAVVAQANDLLKDWKGSATYSRITRTAKTDVPGEKMAIETPDKANAMYVAGHTLALDDADPDYAALRVADFIFGEAPLASRLSNRVRGKDGLSYGVQAQLQIDSLDKFGAFVMVAICNPENIDKVDAAVAEELDKMLKDGVTEKELEEAKKAFLQALKVERASDAQVARLLGECLHANRTCAFYDALEKKVAGLTPEQVSAAFRKHVATKRLIVVRAGDFKAKGGSPK